MPNINYLLYRILRTYRPIQKGKVKWTVWLYPLLFDEEHGVTVHNKWTDINQSKERYATS